MSQSSAQTLLASQLELARELQKAILPSGFPSIRHSSGAARMIPALEVGGDFYDLFELNDGRLGIVIGEKTPLMPVRETRKMGEGRESIAARRVVTICDVRHGLGRK